MINNELKSLKKSKNNLLTIKSIYKPMPPHYRPSLLNPEFKKSNYNPGIIVNNKFRRKKIINNDWIKVFLKNFNIIKYHHLILIEGFKIIIKLYKLNKINNPKLEIFINEGWFRLLVSCKNKIELIQSFEYFYDLITKKNTKYRSLASLNNPVNKKVKIQKYNRKVWITFGINKYTNWNNLNNAENDAKCLAEFSKKFNFESQIFLNEDVTKNSIENIIKSYLYNTASYNDLIVISFHGHGHTIKIEDNSYGFFVPYDAPLNATPGDLISTNDISSWCKYIKAKHILLLFDCCFSGHSVMRSDGNRKYSIDTIDVLLSKKSRIAINAGTEEQKVADDGWNNNSVFTGCLMSYPGFYDKFCSVISLYNYLVENVPKHCSQTPTIGKLIGDQGGDIFLAL